MSIVGIFEDSHYDAIKRYKGLVDRGHELHVCILNLNPMFRKFLKEDISKSGFNPKALYFELSEMPKNLDIYFSDGLGGLCFSVADQFGKDKTLINSGDSFLMNEAKADGYRTLERGTFAEEVVSQLKK